MLSLAGSNEDEHKVILTEGLQSALDLARRCIDNSVSFWVSKGGSVTPKCSKKNKLENLVREKIVHFLQDVAHAHHINQAIVDSILRTTLHFDASKSDYT